MRSIDFADVREHLLERVHDVAQQITDRVRTVLPDGVPTPDTPQSDVLGPKAVPGDSDTPSSGGQRGRKS